MGADKYEIFTFGRLAANIERSPEGKFFRTNRANANRKLGSNRKGSIDRPGIYYDDFNRFNSLLENTGEQLPNMILLVITANHN
jgi:hypothetical protein